MDAPQTPEETASARNGLPRWLLRLVGLFVFLVFYPLMHAVLPWLLSWLAPRYGWTNDRPGLANLLGLVPTLAGAAGLYWILVTALRHWNRVPERVKLGLTPPYLLTHGPYAVTRHPIYVTIVTLWLGWTIFYGSLIVLAGFVVLALVALLLVPREERALERQFGEEYRQYKARVPRWLALPRR